MKRFTPGPWSTGHNVYGHSRLAVLNERDVIVAEVTDWPDEGRTEANARLIAAAPDMYKRLIAAAHALRSYQHGNSATSLARGIADEIDATIEKVRGEVTL